jgi:hypothetical protein
MKAKVTSNKVQGEGDYKAAKPTSPADQEEMTQAEQVGLSKSKGGKSVATLSVKKKKST